MEKQFQFENFAKLESDERKKMIPAKMILDKLNIKPNDRILDFGAGIGYFSIPALDYLGTEGKIIALDISSNMLDELKSRLDNNIDKIDFIVSDGSKIEIYGNKIDKILIAFVYHEIDNRTALINEFMSVLNSDGEVFLLDWHLVESPFGPPLDHRIDKNIVIQEFTNLGFEFVNSELINDFQYFLKFKIK